METDWLHEAFRGPAWHGPALLPTLRGVDEALAAWRPSAGRHSIREIVVHAAWWKHTVRRRITGDRDATFPYRGRNWFTLPPGEDSAGFERSWRDDVRLLGAEHEALAASVAKLPARAATRIVHAGQTAAFNIRGAGAHDIYHAGQIQLIKALRQRRQG